MPSPIGFAQTAKTLLTSSEAKGVAIAAVSSAINKSAGAFNRIEDVKKDPAYVQDYVKKRELLNIALATGMNLGVQMLTYKPLKKLLPNLHEGFVRMLMIAPGLYLSEYLSRQFAGKKDIIARQNQDRESILNLLNDHVNGITFSSFKANSRFQLAETSAA